MASWVLRQIRRAFRWQTPQLARRISYYLAILLLFGCRPTEAQPVSATSFPTPQAVRVAISIAARPAEGALHACAETIPELALILHEVPEQNQELNTFDLTLRLGEPPETGIFQAPLANEQIILIAQKDIPIVGLSQDDIQLLFSGEARTWGEFFGPQASFNTGVILYGYTPSDPLRQLFESATFNSPGALPAQLFLAPDPAAMREAVAEIPGAIGYLPRAWLNDSVTEIPLPENLETALSVPLLLAAVKPPSGAADALVRCLQSPTGQAALAEYYLPFK